MSAHDAAPEQRRQDASQRDTSAHTFAKRGRAWAVHDPAGELVALVLYRKGAREVVRRLEAAPAATEGTP